jgi:hypothetical protein
MVACGGWVVVVAACGWRWRSDRGGGDEHRGPATEGHDSRSVDPHVGLIFSFSQLFFECQIVLTAHLCREYSLKLTTKSSFPAELYRERYADGNS